MIFLFPFFIAFTLILFSELGDKTQLLVLSFSSKLKVRVLLLGIAIGSLFSHGVAILFGSVLGSFNNIYFHIILKVITYISFIIFGIITFCSSKETENSLKNNSLLKRSNWGYVFFIAFSIAIGELGDKTFLASIGLGIQYPLQKVALILGAITGMIASDSLAILLGKSLSEKISEKSLNILSSFLFILFGILGLIHLVFLF